MKIHNDTSRRYNFNMLYDIMFVSLNKYAKKWQ